MIARKTIFLFLFFAIQLNTVAQDRIIKKDGTTIDAKVLAISSTQIKYHNFSQPDGPLRIIETYLVKEINYESGIIETFNVEANESLLEEELAAQEQRPPPRYAQRDMMGAGFAIDLLVGVSQFSRLYDLNSYYNPAIPFPGDKKIVTNDFSVGLRISNKFYFDVRPKWRTGIQLSYVRVNFRFNKTQGGISSLSLTPIHIGTTNIIRLNEKFGLEANTVIGATFSYDNTANGVYNFNGFTLNPEVKFRYKLLAVGIDYSITTSILNNPMHRLHQLSVVIGLKF